MTSAQLVLVSVTSALVAVFVMLLVATIKRARIRDDELRRETTGPKERPDEREADEPS